MNYINKFKTTNEFELEKEQLNKLKHFVAYDSEVNKVYLKKEITMNTILINQLETDPSSMISGDVNGEIIQWIRQNSHRVLAKKTSEGAVSYIELDDNNSNKYAIDGSEANTDGTEGDVFVKLPTFYYHGTEGNNVEIKFSKIPFKDSIEWDTNILIGAYEAYYGDGKLQSRSGVESSGNISQENFKSYAAARGKGYQLVDWQMHCVLVCLFYAIYGNTNSQAICGKGVNSSNKICGETNSLGMNDTRAETNGNTMSINFYGLENWWGNKSEWMQEDNINTIMNVYDPLTKGTRNISIPNYKNFKCPKHMVFGKYLDIIVSSDDPNDGIPSVGYCDGQYWDNSLNSICLERSEYYANLTGGISRINAYKNSSETSEIHTSRLAFRGIATKAESVEAFKELPI